MKALSSLILVVALALAAGCFGGKRGPRGTNVGPNTDQPSGPWSESSPTHAVR